jgi:nucleoside-diphosphate-sugar epimerase
VIIGDLSHSFDWSKLLEGVGVVIHLANKAHSRETAPDLLYRINVAATLALGEAAAAQHVERLVFVSSVHVNGQSTTSRPFTERDTPRPSDAYAVSKWQAEIGLREIAARTNLDVVVVRPTLVHGPGVKGNLARLMAIIAKGVPLPFAGFDNSRSFVSVNNLSHLLSLCVKHPGAAHGLFLAADEHDLSTPELIRVIANAMGRDVRMFGLPGPMLRALAAFAGQSGVLEKLEESLQVDAHHARSALDWHPTETLEADIRSMVESFIRGEPRQ